MFQRFRLRVDAVDAVQWDGSDESTDAIRILAGAGCFVAYGRPTVFDLPLNIGDWVVKDGADVRALRASQFVNEYEAAE